MTLVDSTVPMYLIFRLPAKGPSAIRVRAPLTTDQDMVRQLVDSQADIVARRVHGASELEELMAARRP